MYVNAHVCGIYLHVRCICTYIYNLKAATVRLGIAQRFSGLSGV